MHADVPGAVYGALEPAHVHYHTVSVPLFKDALANAQASLLHGPPGTNHHVTSSVVTGTSFKDMAVPKPHAQTGFGRSAVVTLPGGNRD